MGVPVLVWKTSRNVWIKSNEMSLRLISVRIQTNSFHEVVLRSPYHTPSATKQLETTRLPVDSPSGPAKSRLPQPDSQGCQAPAHWQLLQNCHALEIPLQQDCYTNVASCRFVMIVAQNEHTKTKNKSTSFDESWWGGIHICSATDPMACQWQVLTSDQWFPWIMNLHLLHKQHIAAQLEDCKDPQRFSHCWAPVQHRIETWVWCPQAWPNQWHTRSQGVQHHQLLGPEISLLPSHSNRLAKTFQVARPTRKVIATTWNQKTSTAKILMNNNCASDIEKPKLGTYKAESSFH